jgi:hypothetical protein
LDIANLYAVCIIELKRAKTNYAFSLKAALPLQCARRLETLPNPPRKSCLPWKSLETTSSRGRKILLTSFPPRFRALFRQVENISSPDTCTDASSDNRFWTARIGWKPNRGFFPTGYGKRYCRLEDFEGFSTLASKSLPEGRLLPDAVLSKTPGGAAIASFLSFSNCCCLDLSGSFQAPECTFYPRPKTPLLSCLFFYLETTSIPVGLAIGSDRFQP